MTEEFLHYIWQYKLFLSPQFISTDGDVVEVMKTGDHNTNAGPDFFNARIKIGNTLWAGNVEVHIKSSDWEKHHHEKDNTYDNVILHVVLEEDKKIKRKNGESIPTLELKNNYSKKSFQKYIELQSSKSWIPCEKQIKDTDEFILHTWLERLTIKRLERKSVDIITALKQSNNNWEEILYQFLAKSLSGNINGEALLLLAKATPLSLIRKASDKLAIEALLFGQSGLLDSNEKDEYTKSLNKEYTFLKQKYRLLPLEKHLWKFLRLRPANFPTIRIAQLAGILSDNKNLFSKIIESKKVRDIEKIFTASVSDYWKTHYQFSKKSRKKEKHLGKSTIHSIIINTIVPFLFIYGQQKRENDKCDLALQLLEELPGEKNNIISNFSSLGIKVASAHKSQALIELKNEYCSKIKCLECAVGLNLLKK